MHLENPVETSPACCMLVIQCGLVRVTSLDNNSNTQATEAVGQHFSTYGVMD
jgi:hypothetical protein